MKFDYDVKPKNKKDYTRIKNILLKKGFKRSMTGNYIAIFRNKSGRISVKTTF